jgi:hypothetical protein
MGLMDVLLGRTRPVPANLDQLFALPSAAITLEAGTDFVPTGIGSVCFRAVEGKAFDDIEKDVTDLLSMGEHPTPVKLSEDSFGFTWVVSTHAKDDVEGLVTDLHAVNSSLEANGFGPQLLCTILGFTGSEGPLGIVYLYKRGTFYPFAPRPGERRDNATEIRVKGVLVNDLKIEPELGRWFPVWGAPGL